MSPTFFLFPNARVVYANTYRFSSAQRVLCGPVESRMLLWCREGTGSIVANGLRSAMVPGDFWLLPWGHTIEYLAARNDPFHLGGIHLVPEHDDRSDPIFDVAHHAASPLAGHPGRKDVAVDGLDQPHAGRLEDIPAAAGLLDHIVSRFHEDGNLNVLSALWGPLLLEEIVYWVRSPPPRSVPMPRELRSLTDYIKANLGSSLSLSDLAAQSGKSRSTVGRLFRRHLECSPVEWMLKLKMDRAAELLRTRKLTAAEAGYQVGINDPSYFNRCFRRRHGVAPGTYRNQQVLL